MFLTITRVWEYVLGDIGRHLRNNISHSSEFCKNLLELSAQNTSSSFHNPKP